MAQGKKKLRISDIFLVFIVIFIFVGIFLLINNTYNKATELEQSDFYTYQEKHR